MKRRIILVSIIMALLVGVVYAASTFTVNTPGHVHINKGNRAGLMITPSIIEFGNVTVGDPANVTVIVLNIGNCQENVTLTVSAVNIPQQPTVYSPFTLQPGMTIEVLAVYTASQTLLMPPGDYSFTLTSDATCI